MKDLQYNPPSPVELMDQELAAADGEASAGFTGPAPTAVSNSKIELDRAEPLANRKAPHYYVQQERPAHRIALELAAKGYDVKEIAARMGYTPVAVNNWLRQPHAQQTLVDTIHKNMSVDDEVVEIVKNNALAAAKLYEAILNDPKQDIKLRAEIAERFHNRRYGKPNQPINRGTDVDLNDLPDSELAKMLKQN